MRAGEDRYAGDVGRHQVGGELEPLELDVEREREGAHEQRLGGPGHSLEQHMAARQQAHQHIARGGLLPQDHLLQRV